MRALALITLLTTVCLAHQSVAPGFQELAARATAARQSNQIPEAIDLYTQAVAANPKWEEGWWYLGTIFYDGNQYAKAQNALTHMLALDPKAIPALSLRGLCEFETGDYSQSLADIQQSLSSNSSQIQPEM